METYHIILGCHMRDREKMTALLHGMEAHSAFFAFYMCEAFDGAPHETFNDLMHRPVMDLWQGFFNQAFDHETLCGLLESITWVYPKAVFIAITCPLQEAGVISRSVGEYRTAVDLGRVLEMKV